jgi:hypothetical protein
MNFVLMIRKGHKQQYKSLAVPINSELALNLKNREEVSLVIFVSYISTTLYKILGYYIYFM